MFFRFVLMAFFICQNSFAFKSGEFMYQCDIYYEEAKKFTDNNQYQKAIDVYDKAENEGNRNPCIYSRRAILYSIFLKNEKMAILDYTKSIDILSEDKKNGCHVLKIQYWLRGKSYFNNGQNNEAMSDINKVFEIEKECQQYYDNNEEDKKKIDVNNSFLASAFSVKSQINFNLGKINEALQDIDEAIKIDKKYQIEKDWLLEGIDGGIIKLDPKYQKGKDLIDKKYQQETKNFQLKIKIISNLLQDGERQYNDKNYNKSISYYKKVLEIDNKNYSANLGICLNYENLFDNKKVLNCYSKLIELDSKATRPYILRSRIHYMMNNYNSCIKDANIAIDRKPFFETGFAYYVRGLCYEAKKQYHKALIDFEEAVDIDIQTDYVMARDRALIMVNKLNKL